MNRACVVVTGSAGFIGSHLCERLVEDDHAVIVIDDYSTGIDVHRATLELGWKPVYNLPTYISTLKQGL